MELIKNFLLNIYVTLAVISLIALWIYSLFAVIAVIKTYTFHWVSSALTWIYPRSVWYLIPIFIVSRPSCSRIVQPFPSSGLPWWLSMVYQHFQNDLFGRRCNYNSFLTSAEKTYCITTANADKSNKQNIGSWLALTGAICAIKILCFPSAPISLSDRVRPPTDGLSSFLRHVQHVCSAHSVCKQWWWGMRVAYVGRARGANRTESLRSCWLPCIGCHCHHSALLEKLFMRLGATVHSPLLQFEHKAAMFGVKIFLTAPA